MSRFATKLLRWFDKFGRKDLPWQKNITPYRVWISEIMLQQTQVATVIPYFERFITKFPNVKALANAQLDDVLHLWTGLGYYARARNIHKTAKIISQEFSQKFPEDLEGLLTLPGIGRSTAGAILSIACKKSMPILDGNVKRVLTRHEGIEGWPGENKVAQTLWTVAEKYTPLQRCNDYTQAIMDLGATLCTRTAPQCPICPLQKSCFAYKEGRQKDFPSPKKRAILPVKNIRFLILQNDKKQILLLKRPLVGIWGGLWCFPECKASEDLVDYCRNEFDSVIDTYCIGTMFRHTFSHFHLDITPIYATILRPIHRLRDSDALWCPHDNIPAVGLAAPIKKLLQQFSLNSNG